MHESGVKTKSAFIPFTAVCFEDEGLISGHLRIVVPSVCLRRFRCHGKDLACPFGKFDRENFQVGFTDGACIAYCEREIGYWLFRGRAPNIGYLEAFFPIFLVNF